MMDQNTCFAYLNMELPDDIITVEEGVLYLSSLLKGRKQA